MHSPARTFRELSAHSQSRGLPDVTPLRCAYRRSWPRRFRQGRVRRCEICSDLLIPHSGLPWAEMAPAAPAVLDLENRFPLPRMRPVREGGSVDQVGRSVAGHASGSIIAGIRGERGAMYQPAVSKISAASKRSMRTGRSISPRLRARRGEPEPQHGADDWEVVNGMKQRVVTKSRWNEYHQKPDPH